ncbi:phospholipase D family protein [Teredinibacter franksiae]|uniref:phospholipase D family protein n=1 Tax=Teredinibacter franksiae TaxID=2761453 RepID=UPI001627FDDD|nr:phospholipase D family protein [Teredinibacter franksiae]
MIKGFATLKKYATLFMVLLAAGCATVDHEYPRNESYAPPASETRDTAFGQYVKAEMPKHAEGESGFVLLADGVEAFAARLAMAENAEKTLDVQYYLISEDLIGHAFIGSLLKTADRGVRVRLLVDDILTKGFDHGMAALDSHPNLEVRIFNPFASRTLRPMDMFQFTRLNRRMHNKSFTVDNQITLIGGRNIADEYFGARTDLNFGDLDVVGFGPVVQEVSSMFDEYWNSWAALPVPAFADMPKDLELELASLRQRINKKLSTVSDGIYAEAIKQDYDRLLGEESGRAVWTTYDLAYDSPDKADSKKAKTATNITTKLNETIRGGSKEFILISPYFVPLKSGEQFFQELVDKGMEVSVITNSLAANNHGSVHSGYAPSRKRLLKMGVKLYEVKSEGINQEFERVGNDQSRATLHTKAFMVDREKIFIGSFNWDPRSININTELGVIIDSPEIGESATINMSEKLAEKTYEVVLNDKGKLRWIDRSGPEEVVYTKEPNTTWWKRFSVGFMSILPIKSQL